MKYKICFLPVQREVMASEEDTLLQIMADHNVLINGSCGGKGFCGKCRIKLLEGRLTPLTEKESACIARHMLGKEERLACQCKAKSDLVLMIPEEQEGLDRKKRTGELPHFFKPSAGIHKDYIQVPPAEMQTQINDLDRIRAALGRPDLQFQANILPQLSESLKKGDGITVTVKDHTVLDAESGDTSRRCYGVSADIGTTTVAVMLWDLNSGRQIDAEAGANPQAHYGADVISRIQYCMEADGNVSVLQNKIISCLNQMIFAIASRQHIRKEHIYEIAVDGNTTMSHIFLGADPAGMARVPFTPVFCEGWNLRARDLGLQVNSNANVFLLPEIAGHVGGDITAVMLATDLFRLPGNTVVIDIGTNGEIMAAGAGRAVTCSTAAGPAFEGAGICCGMRAAPGAIEGVVIGDQVEIRTIGDKEPTGICGSGIIDAVAAMLKAGIINMEGNLLSREEAEEKGLPLYLVQRLFDAEEYNPSFILYKKNPDSENHDGDIVLTQRDIREIQLAKAAILGGIYTLLDKLMIQTEQIDRLLIAGAFGSYINKESAVVMGLLPPMDLRKIHSVGNAAGLGVSMALLSEEVKKQAECQSRQIKHVELSQDPVFQNYYIEGMFFPDYGNNETD